MSRPCLHLPLVVTLVVSFFHPRVSGCDPAHQPSIREKVEFSHVVAQGMVEKHYPPNLQSPEDQYIAELHVWCVFKNTGKPVPVTVNITNGGSNEGRCFMSELFPGQQYVVFLRRLGSKYIAHVKEIRVTDAAAVSMVTSTCGLEVKDVYPQGVTENTTSHKCSVVNFRPCPTLPPEVIVKRTKPTRTPKVSKPVTPSPSTTYRHTYAESTTSTTTMTTTTTTGVATDTHVNVTTSIPYVVTTMETMETSTTATSGRTLAPPSESSGVSRWSWRESHSVYVTVLETLVTVVLLYSGT